MKKKLIDLNLFIFNFLFWYLIVRLTGDTHLNEVLDMLLDFMINNISTVIALVIGVFIPSEKAKEIISNLKK